MRELADTARRWAAQGRPAVLARPITEQGFGPRHPADALLIDEDGNRQGTLTAVRSTTTWPQRPRPSRPATPRGCARWPYTTTRSKRHG
ncbi:XdhC family protein [Streptomyces mirabilis]|uniref:XdhC family protein n=1 Tax=Streptomyces mirabilis TaxID=68239 RepID=UPI0036A7FF1F